MLPAVLQNTCRWCEKAMFRQGKYVFKPRVIKYALRYSCQMREMFANQKKDCSMVLLFNCLFTV